MSVQFTDFEKLRKSIKKYGISDFQKKSKQIKEFEDKGLDIDDLSDLFSTNNKELFVVLEDGSIRKAVMYIVDISSWNEKWGLPKFHIYQCKTIMEMKSRGKQKRYRLSSKTNGEFYLIKNSKKWTETLKICNHCRKKYDKQTIAPFSLKEWLENPFNDSNLPKVSLDFCTVPNRYTDSWTKISRTRKKQVNYECQNCKKDFSDPICQKFLHTHHKDSDKRNNTRENLEVLCIECHSNEYNHQHIKQSDMYKEWLSSECKKQIDKQ